MKKKIAVVVLTLALVMFSGVVSAASLQITNKAGFDFYEVHFAPGNDSRWGDDVLNMNVILNDETVTVHWDKGDKPTWNIMVVDEFGRKSYWRKLNVTDGARVILKPEGNVEL
ncbi:MAG: hypothetical protein H6Q72_4941 [Firmicutes bacterium]|nr:hypothetical protein [Bacillota bacterium]